MSLQDPPILAPQHTDDKYIVLCPEILRRCWDVSWGPHICTASRLLTELFSKPLFLFHFFSSPFVVDDNVVLRTPQKPWGKTAQAAPEAGSFCLWSLSPSWVSLGSPIKLAEEVEVTRGTPRGELSGKPLDSRKLGF